MAETHLSKTEQDTYDSRIAAVLHYRYGDGFVYLPKRHAKDLYLMARKMGYIDSDGYLTRKGRALLARFQYI